MTDKEGRVFTCGTCREQMDENDRDVPCDSGGVNACPYWNSNGTSPGAFKLSEEDQTAWDLYLRVQAFGWDMVKTLCDLELTPYQADELLEKFLLIRAFEAGQESQSG